MESGWYIVLTGRGGRFVLCWVFLKFRWVDKVVSRFISGEDQDEEEEEEEKKTKKKRRRTIHRAGKLHQPSQLPRTCQTICMGVQ